MDIDEQLRGRRMRSLLGQLLQAEGGQRARLQWSHVARQDWAEGLDRREIMDLIEPKLEQGPWIILDPKDSHERGFMGAEFTDPEGHRRLYGT
jgi:hypothetical protein